MGLMLDALKQIEVRTSVPLILPMPQETETPIFQVGMIDARADEPDWLADEHADITKAAFDVATPRPSYDVGTAIAWPPIPAEHGPHFARAAETILHQIAHGADISLCFVQRPMVIGFVSARDGDGTTSVVMGLAPHLSGKLAAGMVVVDANCTKPDLTERLGLLADMAGNSGGMLYPTCLSGLHMLPAASCGQTPSWIDDLRETWSLAILDTPSLEHAHVGPLLRCCDGVYLVVRLGHTPRRAVRQATRSISQCGAKLLGSIAVV